MKKLWNRFRRWLILKLGGYTTPYSLDLADTIRAQSRLQLVRVTAVVTFPPEDIVLSEFTPHFIKERLAREMYRELVKSGLIVYQRCDDYDPLGISYRASFKAVVPKGEVDYGD